MEIPGPELSTVNDVCATYRDGTSSVSRSPTASPAPVQAAMRRHRRARGAASRANAISSSAIGESAGRVGMGSVRGEPIIDRTVPGRSMRPPLPEHGRQGLKQDAEVLAETPALDVVELDVRPNRVRHRAAA